MEMVLKLEGWNMMSILNSTYFLLTWVYPISFNPKKYNTMKKLNYTILILLVIFASSCVNEDYFGYSSFGEIKSIQISNQSGIARINSKEKTVAIEIPAGIFSMKGV